MSEVEQLLLHKLPCTRPEHHVYSLIDHSEGLQQPFKLNTRFLLDAQGEKMGGHSTVHYHCVHYHFGSADGSASTVANATGKKLRIFYHKEKLNLEDFLDSETTKKIFKPKAELPFTDLSPKQHLEVSCVDEGFASVFVADPEDGEVYVETIALNFEVPYGACCIVTTNNEIKFRKPDGGIWIDEDDHDHSPPE